MAHELTMNGDVAEMAFVGATPWHGLGQKLEQDASFDEWQIAAGMNWSIESSPVQFYNDDSGYATNVFDGKNVLYRSDTKAPLSIVTDRYKAVQPVEVLHFFKSLVEENGFKLHTAGTLFGGKRMWALAETGNFGEVSKDDGVGGFLLLSTSCDRSLSTTARFTTVRVVCNNTLSWASQDNTNMVSFNHMQKFDHEAVKTKLASSVASFGSFMEMAKFLQKQQLDMGRAKTFLLELLKEPEQDFQIVPDSKPYQKILSLYESEAKGHELAEHTKWGMLNAVTEYFDHHATNRTQDSKLNSAWFGNGNKVKTKAVELLLA
ncbi:LGT_TIGR03299, phage/plasmid-like protein TIGR03299 [uncultured Caudovirales phage]|uniref:LGT_TIGR03299, phage/plasmid-like protein TIGR03299 n=1 Tax=uncultured Caudovirales phage TaxID=2100421 RepID=A0A6J5KNA4_9CAUD|nr:LGT_TIGR03299, phage/plasmid-like protein TIGR03299 [uncultured Caudovirales phage]